MSKKEAIALFDYFKAKEGAQHIAKPVTLDYIITYCIKSKPKRILEIGSGIGTISYAVLKYSNAIVDLYEEEPWCIEQLDRNLNEYKNRYILHTSMEESPAVQEYDLIIVDGGAGAKGDFGFQSAIVTILKQITDIKAIYFEGERKEQQDSTFQYLKSMYTFTCTLHKSEMYEGKMWIGGRSYILKKSKSQIAKNLAYWYWYILYQARIRFRLKRKLKYIFINK